MTDTFDQAKWLEILKQLSSEDIPKVLERAKQALAEQEAKKNG